MKIRIPDPYSTHAGALVWALFQFGGDVLEMGAGYYSTPWLHEFCLGAERELVTWETDPLWRARFETFATAHHRFPDPGVVIGSNDRRVPLVDPPLGDWGVVFVDGAWRLRPHWVRCLHGRGCAVVVHDTNPGAVRACPGMAEALALYDNRRDFTFKVPHTTVLW